MIWPYYVTRPCEHPLVCAESCWMLTPTRHIIPGNRAKSPMHQARSKVYIVINVFKCLAILPLENLENVGQLFAFCLGECWAIVSLGWRMLGNCTLLHLTPAFFWQHLTPAFFWPQTATRVFHVYTSGNFRQSDAMGHTRLSAAVSMMAWSGSSR